MYRSDPLPSTTASGWGWCQRGRDGGQRAAGQSPAPGQARSVQKPVNRSCQQQLAASRQPHKPAAPQTSSPTPAAPPPAAPQPAASLVSRKMTASSTIFMNWRREARRCRRTRPLADAAALSAEHVTMWQQVRNTGPLRGWPEQRRQCWANPGGWGAGRALQARTGAQPRSARSCHTNSRAVTSERSPELVN